MAMYVCTRGRDERQVRCGAVRSHVNNPSEDRRIVLYSVYAVCCIARLYTVVLYSRQALGQSV